MTAAPDDGTADPVLAAALAAWVRRPGPGTERAVLTALVPARLLVPVAATLLAAAADEGAGLRVGKATEVAQLTLARPDGRTAAVAFSDTATLGRWRAEARPVPVPVPALAAAAVSGGHVALVVDPGGAGFVVTGDGLAELAAGRVPTGALPAAVLRAVEVEPAVREVWLLGPEAPADGDGPAPVTVGLWLGRSRPWRPARATREVAARVGARLLPDLAVPVDLVVLAAPARAALLASGARPLAASGRRRSGLLS